MVENNLPRKKHMVMVGLVLFSVIVVLRYSTGQHHDSRLRMMVFDRHTSFRLAISPVSVHVTHETLT